nr:MAG TPA: hypothetical protein [Caudoviricetes sp.]
MQLCFLYPCNFSHKKRLESLLISLKSYLLLVIHFALISYAPVTSDISKPFYV